jgi:sec-independent protein translocase protein TatC
MAPFDPNVSEPEEAKPFLEHLVDLRRTLIRCCVALAAGMAVAFPLAPHILHWLQLPLRAVTDDPSRFLRSLEVGGAFSILMTVAFWTGLLISLPFLLLFIGQFVFPGLRPNERRAVSEAVVLGALLFAFGVALGYRLTLPATLAIMFGMHQWMGIAAEWTITSYVAFSAQTLIAFGLAFEMPVVLLVLARLGLVSHRILRAGRPWAIVIALIIGAFLTPPDVASQLLMAVPLMILYELCVWVTWAAERRKGAASVSSPPSY